MTEQELRFHCPPCARLPNSPSMRPGLLDALNYEQMNATAAMPRASPPNWMCRPPPTTMGAPACAPSLHSWLAINPSPSRTHEHGRIQRSTLWTTCVCRQGWLHAMQRLEATRDRIERFLQRLGQMVRGSGRLYLVGGSFASSRRS